VASVRCQCNLLVCDNKVICYKHVDESLRSLYDSAFVYPQKGEVVCDNPAESNASCAAGLHVSHASYWEGNGGTKVLMCSVNLEDIITVQQGKIRCRKLTVLGVCEGEVF
jgi:hypothetical protein